MSGLFKNLTRSQPLVEKFTPNKNHVHTSDHASDQSPPPPNIPLLPDGSFPPPPPESSLHAPERFAEPLPHAPWSVVEKPRVDLETDPPGVAMVLIPRNLVWYRMCRGWTPSRAGREAGFTNQPCGRWRQYETGAAKPGRNMLEHLAKTVGVAAIKLCTPAQDMGQSAARGEFSTTAHAYMCGLAQGYAKGHRDGRAGFRAPIPGHKCPYSKKTLFIGCLDSIPDKIRKQVFDETNAEIFMGGEKGYAGNVSIAEEKRIIARIQRDGRESLTMEERLALIPRTTPPADMRADAPTAPPPPPAPAPIAPPPSPAAPDALAGLIGD